MELHYQHRWDVTPKEAIAIQQQLRERVITTDDFVPPTTVAGVDVGFEQNNTITRAAVAVLSFPDLVPVADAVVRRPTTFPYVPDLLSFREVPAALEALNALVRLPDLLLCDGQGYAHPRRFGLACHLGVVTDLPTIGVAKSRLTGISAEVGPYKGSFQPLLDRGETIGAVLRTRNHVRPLFVSIGHRVSLPTAIRFVLACTTRYRLPETTRRAHRLASG